MEEASSTKALSRQELCAEAIYELIRRGRMNKKMFEARMSALDQCGPDGAIAACYVIFLLLRHQPPSEEKNVLYGPERKEIEASACLLEPHLEGLMLAFW